MGVLMNLSPVLADGVNVAFLMGGNADLDHLGTPKIYVAGVLKTVTVDYTISGLTVTFGAAPTAGALIQGDYSTLDRN